MRRHCKLLALLFASACAVAPPTPDSGPQMVETPAQATQRRAGAAPPSYNLTGYPPAVREGYIDGCETAKSTRYANKDTKRMASDPQYAMGWNDGFSICLR